MKELPDNVNTYKRTDTFDKASVPKGFLHEHNTKAGVWGKLIVESGSLVYVITELNEEEELVVNAGEFAVIAPEQKHHLYVDDDVRFYVEFYK